MAVHKVTAEQDGARLDVVVAGLADVGSRRRAREAIESGKVKVDGAFVSVDAAGSRLAAGSSVEVVWGRPGTSAEWVRGRAELVEASLSIVFEDRTLIVVDKPPGLLTDSATREQARERDTLRKRLAHYLRAGNATPHVVHRIDRDTSGLVVVAKTEEAEARLRDQFRAHTPERVYWVMVQGQPRGDGGTWEDPMIWDDRKLIQKTVSMSVDGAVMASARWKVLHRGAQVSVLEVRLHTGRRNQIRLHCQLRGHPLVGETLYLPKDWAPVGPAFERQALHAWQLALRHPDSGKRVVFVSPLPEDLRRLCQKAGVPVVAAPVGPA
jgi:23S rRNA pseudouridine1911/1915/1917 synthase